MIRMSWRVGPEFEAIRVNVHEFNLRYPRQHSAMVKATTSVTHFANTRNCGAMFTSRNSIVHLEQCYAAESALMSLTSPITSRSLGIN